MRVFGGSPRAFIAVGGGRIVAEVTIIPH